MSRVSLREALSVLGELRRVLRFGGARLPTIVVGSARRKSPTVRDLDLLVVGGDFGAVCISPRAKTSLRIVRQVTAGKRRQSLVVARRQRHYKVDLFLATPEEKPYALLHHTGPAAYNIRLRALVKKRGLKLNQYGLFEGGRRVRGSAKLRTEKDVQRFLGVKTRSPTQRALEMYHAV